MSDQALLAEEEKEVRAFREEDWDSSAMTAATSALHGTSLCAALANACCCRRSNRAGGVADFMMAQNVGDGVYRSVRATDGLLTEVKGKTTLGEVWEEACSTFSKKQCMGWREILSMTKEGNKERYVLSPYQWITYEQAYQRSVKFGRGLASLGLQKGDKVNFYADTKVEWQLAAQACYKFGFTVATTYANLGEEALKYSINQTKCKVVFTDADLLPTVCNVLGDCPTVKHVVFISDPRPSSHAAHTTDEQLREKVTNSRVEAHSFAQVVLLGEGNLSLEPPALDKSEIAMIMYTSGSTGNPKGVMISHENCVAAIAGASDGITGMGQDDTYVAYLPLAHILEVCAEGACLATGVSIGYGSTKTITDTSVCVDSDACKGDATELRPTLMAAVPMIMDKIRKGVLSKIEGIGGVTQALFERAYASKLEALKRGLDTPLWNRLVFDGLRTRLLGGRLRYMLSGGGPLSEETQEFMNVVFCCPVGQGYGLTECVGCATVLWPNDRSSGRVGAPIGSMQIKLVDWAEGGYYADPEGSDNPRGEVLLGGPQIAMGYFEEPEKSDEAFFEEDGVRWMRTGDIGEIAPDGVLCIIDRKKDLVKLSHGEYVSFGKLEPLMRNSKYVDNAMMYAQSNKDYCVAIVTRPPGAEPVSAEEVQRDIASILKNEGCAKFEIPRKVHVADEEWGPHNDLCTAALKLKRNNIVNFYKDTLVELYQ